MAAAEQEATAQATQVNTGSPKFCAWCGGAVEFAGMIFFEEGGYNGSTYENEGDVETWRCVNDGCGKRMADVPPMTEPRCANPDCRHTEESHSNVCLIEGCECQEFVDEEEAGEEQQAVVLV